LKRQVVYGVILALLITSFSTLEFNIKIVQASSGTILHVDPAASIADFGESFTVNIDIPLTIMFLKRLMLKKDLFSKEQPHL